MITSGFITKLRRKYNDNPVKHEDNITGDGSSTVFKTQFCPIKEGSFSLYRNNTLQVASGYTIDLDTGDITVSSAPTSAVVLKAQYQEVKYRDQNWLEAIQDTFDSFGDRFFKSVLRSPSGMTLSAGVVVYPCPANCIRLTEALESSDYTSGGQFVPINANARYDRWSNKLILGRKPSRSNFMQISYLRKLTRPTAVTSVLDVDDSWLELLDLKSGAAYLRSMANRYAQQGNATIEEGHLSVMQLRQLANDNEVLFENSKKKIKPIMPASKIPYYVPDGGNI